MSSHKDSVDSLFQSASQRTRFLGVEKEQSDFRTIIASVFIISHQFNAKLSVCDTRS